MTSIQKISSYVLLLLGMAHTALTPAFYSQLNEDALWFAGTGLGLVFLALLNLAVLLSPTRTALNLCLVADLVGLMYGILIIFVLRGPEPQPQAYIALAAYLAVTIGTIFSRKTVR